MEYIFINEFFTKAYMVERDFTNPQNTAVDDIWVSLNTMEVVDSFLKVVSNSHSDMNGAHLHLSQDSPRRSKYPASVICIQKSSK